MDAEKLTTRSQEAFSTAVRRAATAGHSQVEPVHLLLALLAQPEGTVRPLLTAAGADPAAITTAAEGMLNRLPAASGATVAAPGVGRATYLALQAAGDTAEKLGDE